METKTQLLEQLRHVLCLKHMSIRTAETYLSWAKRFILFHGKRHPQDMGAPEIRVSLTHLTVHDKMAASTQNGALQTLHGKGGQGGGALPKDTETSICHTPLTRKNRMLASPGRGNTSFPPQNGGAERNFKASSLGVHP